MPQEYNPYEAPSDEPSTSQESRPLSALKIVAIEVLAMASALAAFLVVVATASGILGGVLSDVAGAVVLAAGVVVAWRTGIAVERVLRNSWSH